MTLRRQAALALAAAAIAPWAWVAALHFPTFHGRHSYGGAHGKLWEEWTGTAICVSPLVAGCALLLWLFKSRAE